jgi:integrase
MPGELAGLKWEDFDFKNLHVSVTRSLVDQRVAEIRSIIAVFEIES